MRQVIFLFIFAALLSLSGFAEAELSVPDVLCHQLTTSSQAPAGYAQPYSFATTPELLLTARCAYDNTVRINAESKQSYLFYVYKDGYFWDYTRSKWTYVLMQGNSTWGSGPWIEKRAAARIPVTDVTYNGKAGFFLAYMCQYRDNKWNCGCADRTCARPYWNIQTWNTDPAKLSATFAAEPAAIDTGGKTSLVWTSKNAENCSTTDNLGPWFGVLGISGSKEVAPAATRTFSLLCSNTGNEVRLSTIVAVLDPADPDPHPELTVTPPIVRMGDKVRLEWKSTNATACSAAGAPEFTGSVALLGKAETVVNDTATFTLSCKKGTVTKTVKQTVTVQ